MRLSLCQTQSIKYSFTQCCGQKMKKTLSQIKLKRGVKYGIVSPPNSPEIDDDFVTDHIAYSGQSFESGPQQ